MAYRVGLVTCVELPEPDPDEQHLLDALAARGIAAQLLPWDDPAADAAAYDLCVFRSCWNYHLDPPAFLDWLARAQRVTRLANPTAAVRWNHHKRYLIDLATAGLPTLPTLLIPRGAPTDLAAAIGPHGWRDVVIKPAISAGSFQTRRYQLDQVAEAQAFLDEQLRLRDMLVQRYMPSVDDTGERSVVWIDGRCTHVVRKQPRFADGYERVSDALDVSPRERELAERALAAQGSALLYARVDLIQDDYGELMVSELELIEPSLFFAQCPAALSAFVDAINALCAAGSSLANDAIHE